MKILFLVPYPLYEAPSQRFRFEQYFLALKQNGVTVEVQSFLDTDHWRIFYSPGRALLKGWIILKGYLRRLSVLPRVPSADFVFIHREVTPVGPPIFEWLIAKIFGSKIIYDFDDAIWLTDKLNEGTLEKWIRHRIKVASICGWAHKVSAGNPYLQEYAAKFNAQSVFNPTTIDTDQVHNPTLHPARHEPGKVVIGWTGSHSTLKYLRDLAPVFFRLHQKYRNLSILVIANKAPDFDLPALDYRPWAEATEISDLLWADIGVMPLPDDQWANGKCGFKALQYMALNLPTVASPVGVNRQIVQEGVTGFLCTTDAEWEDRLTLLIENAELRKKMGEAGRQKVIDEYSVFSNTPNFLNLFDLA